jgi:hypothetical protein
VVKDESYFDSNDGAYKQVPQDIGAQGGNAGLLDGSAAWRDIKKYVLTAPRVYGTPMARLAFGKRR